jgi:phospholipid transport system substrate-binding protein
VAQGSLWGRAAGLAIAVLALFTATARSDGEAPIVPPPPESDASVTVEMLHTSLVEVMKEAEQLGYAGRYARLEPVMKDLFDLPFMAEKAVGRYWDEVTQEERDRLVDAFSRYTIANFAGRFDGYSGQHFETLGREPSARDTLMVRTRLIDPGRESVQLDYRLHASGSRWRIVDIYMNGAVSELALRRSEYASLIKREGFAALLAALDARVQELATAPADKET